MKYPMWSAGAYTDYEIKCSFLPNLSHSEGTISNSVTAGYHLNMYDVEENEPEWTQSWLKMLLMM